MDYITFAEQKANVRLSWRWSHKRDGWRRGGDTADRIAVDLIDVALKVESTIGLEVQIEGVRLHGAWSTRPIVAVLTLVDSCASIVITSSHHKA